VDLVVQGGALRVLAGMVWGLHEFLGAHIVTQLATGSEPRRDNRGKTELNSVMTILLAPMEGLLDFVLRDILTRVGGVDRCVSEFIRITHTLLPARVFVRHVPELLHGGNTFAGVPVRPQLLGSDPTCLAENAAFLATLGPHGVDLNFGCPARVVNRHGGGAALLDEPELLHRIVTAVRRAVPAHAPVSAKMRLGFNDDRRAEECALAIEAGGACELVVHARTKAHGYRPPAYWERIADIRAAVRIPVVANGEIWTVPDAQRCRSLSGCDSLMLGRGMVADPGLALAVGAAHATDGAAIHGAVSWQALLPLIADFWQLVRERLERRQQAGRLKQWLNLLRRRYPEAETAYQALRTITEPALIDQWMHCHVAAGAPRVFGNAR
jgi:tRNA-dihydrouridine synthase C